MADLSELDLDRIQSQLSACLSAFGVKCGSLNVGQSTDDILQMTGVLLADRLLPKAAGQEHGRETSFVVKGFPAGEVSGRPIIWAEVDYSVDRDHSFFHPVPDEYGERVSICFGWEFDAETLEPSYADVRERSSVHYVSVLPCDEIRVVVRCFAEVASKWIDRTGGE